MRSWLMVALLCWWVGEWSILFLPLRYSTNYLFMLSGFKGETILLPLATLFVWVVLLLFGLMGKLKGDRLGLYVFFLKILLPSAVP